MSSSPSSGPPPEDPPGTIPSPSDRGQIVGESAAIRSVLNLIDRVASTPATVLITGESGTGKEMVAREIHRRGNRASGAFVAISAAAIPPNLLEAELFGYEKGAFTDAKARKRGLLEMASGGTLFLDEIGLMPVDLQVKILAVLETRTFRRLGGTDDLHTDARVVSATNENLEEAVAAGRFRQDLYYRLRVIPVLLPPLRDREADALHLARHFLDIYSGRYQKGSCRLSPAAERWLLRYPWPGNVREVRNVIERAVLLSPTPLIQVEDLAQPGEGKEALRPQGHPPAVEVTGLGEVRITLPPWGIALEDVERRLIHEALKNARGNLTTAAQLLHISRDTLRYRVRKFKIRKSVDWTGEAG